jgi:hypothetical protein
MNELIKCHHCGHEWEPRVKQPKKCPQCQNPLWKSDRPKKRNVVMGVDTAGEGTTSITSSEEVAPMPPTTDTSTEEVQSDASGVVEPEVETEPLVLRLQREAEERLRRLADAPVD